MYAGSALLLSSSRGGLGIDLEMPRQADQLIRSLGASNDNAVLAIRRLERDVTVDDVVQDRLRVALEWVTIAATTWQCGTHHRCVLVQQQLFRVSVPPVAQLEGARQPRLATEQA